jgi:hypothetical protein
MKGSGARSVEDGLESAPPSGRVSVEHVHNVLARLNAAPRPGNVITSLQVSTPPLADTARYDTLRASAVNAGQEPSSDDGEVSLFV